MTDQYTPTQPDVNPRFQAFEELFKDLSAKARSDPTALREGDFNTLAMLLDEAGQSGDDALVIAFIGLQSLLSALACKQGVDETRGRLLAHLDQVRWAQKRVLPDTIIRRVEPNSPSHDFLVCVGEKPGLSDAQLAGMMTDRDRREVEIDRIGHRLLDEGLVVRRHLGQFDHWELTPWGKLVLRRHPPTPTQKVWVNIARLEEYELELKQNEKKLQQELGQKTHQLEDNENGHRRALEAEISDLENWIAEIDEQITAVDRLIDRAKTIEEKREGQRNDGRLVIRVDDVELVTRSNVRAPEQFKKDMLQAGALALAS